MVSTLLNWVADSGIVSLAIWAYAIFVVALLIYEERDPSTTLAWAFALFLFPGLGLVAYFVFGRNWRVIARRDRTRQTAEALGDARMAPVYDRWAAQAAEAVADSAPFVRRIATAIERQNRTRPLPCVDLSVMPSGAEKFPRLFADIEAARDSIHLEYFIWESDELTGRLCELLKRKVAEGVEVRVMYDWVGSIAYGKKQLAALKDAGGQVHADAAHWSKLNYRNHRKIAVIDGRIGYTGGMNMGQEYIDGKPRYATWRDTHARMRGPIVADLQRMFAERWYRVAKEDLFADRYFPELHADGERVIWAHLGHSGPESDYEALRNTFLLAILSAEKEVRIQSPYFVPDESILQALITQSLSGVDVRFMMTGVPDKKIAWNAAFSYIDELVGAHGRMLQYEAGFFHPKVMTIDGQVAVVGTTNFDIRSFMLHDELSLFFYDAQTALECNEHFERDTAACREITMSDYSRMGVRRRFANAFARLWSRLL